MPTEYSLPDVLERLYQNQLALEAAVMELTLRVEHQGATDTGDNVRGALDTIGEQAKHPHGTVKSPRHIVFYRVANDDVIEVVRLLHGAMEVQLHLPND